MAFSEQLENIFGVFGIKPSAGVGEFNAQKINIAVLPLDGRKTIVLHNIAYYRYPCRLTFFPELNGVEDQVVKQQLQLFTAPLNFRKCSCINLKVLVLEIDNYLKAGLPDDLVQVAGLHS